MNKIDKIIKEYRKEIEGLKMIITDGLLKDCLVYHGTIKSFSEEFIIEKIKETLSNQKKELLDKIINHINLMWGNETDIDISPIINYIEELK